MNATSQRLGLRIASVLFGLMSIAQLLRLLMRLDVLVASHAIPFSVSAVACMVLAGLSLWLWRLSIAPAD
jgi:uncharacterized membrane protein